MQQTCFVVSHQCCYSLYFNNMDALSWQLAAKHKICMYTRGQKQTFARVLLYVWSASFLSPQTNRKIKKIQLYIPNNNHYYNKKRVTQIKQLACNTQPSLEYLSNHKFNIDTQTSRYENLKKKKMTPKSKGFKKKKKKKKLNTIQRMKLK